MGIEPTYPAWKAGVLPLNYARMAVPNDVQLKDNNNIFANCQYFCAKNIKFTLKFRIFVVAKRG